MVKRIAIIGSTGSIGLTTLRVAEHLSDQIEVVGLAAGSNWERLGEQLTRCQPELVALFDPKAAVALQKRYPRVRVVAGREGVEAVAAETSADLVVVAACGMVGLFPTLAALSCGKDVALANKEALVAGGGLVMGLARERGVRLLPIDSEHSALFQCLGERPLAEVDKLVLTASGGPFRNWSDEQLRRVTVADALCHPNWKMGPKITVDSSTLMNKGLEVIEAFWLFDLPPSRIEVVIHPESIIHGVVEFVDGSLIAQMGTPDMATPIQYALTYPVRAKGTLPPFNWAKMRQLHFSIPDKQRFSCLDLAYRALKEGGSCPCYLNGANEELVRRFLAKEIPWVAIGKQLERLMERHQKRSVDTLDAILAVDEEARREAAVVY